MSELGTKEVFIVSIFSVNAQGKRSKFHDSCDDMGSVSRLILTYKPTRNYEVIEIRVTKELNLTTLFWQVIKIVLYL